MSDPTRAVAPYLPEEIISSILSELFTSKKGSPPDYSSIIRLCEIGPGWLHAIQRELYKTIKPKNYLSITRLRRSLLANERLGGLIQSFSLLEYMSEQGKPVKKSKAGGKKLVGNLCGPMLSMMPNLRELYLGRGSTVQFDLEVHNLLRKAPTLSNLRLLRVTSGFSPPPLDSLISLLIAAPHLIELHLDFETFTAPRFSTIDKEKITLKKLEKLSFKGLRVGQLISDSSIFPLEILRGLTTLEAMIYEESVPLSTMEMLFIAVGPSLIYLDLLGKCYEGGEALKHLVVLQHFRAHRVPRKTVNFLSYIPSVMRLEVCWPTGLNKMLLDYNKSPIPISLQISGRPWAEEKIVEFHLLPAPKKIYRFELGDLDNIMGCKGNWHEWED